MVSPLLPPSHSVATPVHHWPPSLALLLDHASFHPDCPPRPSPVPSRKTKLPRTLQPLLAGEEEGGAPGRCELQPAAEPGVWDPGPKWKGQLEERLVHAQQQHRAHIPGECHLEVLFLGGGEREKARGGLGGGPGGSPSRSCPAAGRGFCPRVPLGSLTRYPKSRSPRRCQWPQAPSTCP